MKLSTGSLEPATLSTLPADLLVVLVTADPATDPDALASAVSSGSPLAELDRALEGELTRSILAERFRARAGQTLLLTPLGRLPARRLALVGVGATASPEALRPAAGRAARLAQSCGAAALLLAAPTAAPELRAACAQALCEGALLGNYRFDKYLSEDQRNPSALSAVDVRLPGDAPLDDALARAARTARAVSQARDLVNEPAEFLTPTRMAEVATRLAQQYGLSIDVLDRARCEQERMALFLAVARGSAQEPRFIHLTWRPPAPRRRIALVGKGVTFDSGGYSLKPSDGMLDMKTDMSGAAAVLSAIAVAAEEKLPVEVHAFAACTENMIGGNAYRLGDVFRARSGKTVEINNTDAEGRLTLADAICYARDVAKPDALIDFATLTGACVVALGPHTAGVMSNNEPLQRAFLDAATQAGEPMWPLPLPERLTEQLKSEVADMKNTGERWGGALTAGLFLKEFVGDTPWVHVDLAGPARADKDHAHIARGGTGFAVASILAYLRSL